MIIVNQFFFQQYKLQIRTRICSHIFWTFKIKCIFFFVCVFILNYKCPMANNAIFSIKVHIYL